MWNVFLLLVKKSKKAAIIFWRLKLGIVVKFCFIFKRINSLLKGIWNKLKGVENFIKQIKANIKKSERKRIWKRIRNKFEANLKRINNQQVNESKIYWSEFLCNLIEFSSSVKRIVLKRNLAAIPYFPSPFTSK